MNLDKEYIREITKKYNNDLKLKAINDTHLKIIKYFCEGRLSKQYFNEFNKKEQEDIIKENQDYYYKDIEKQYKDIDKIIFANKNGENNE